jgi:hypothetical protein
MAITLTRRENATEPIWKISDGFTAMSVTDEELRDLVRQAVTSGLYSSSGIRALMSEWEWHAPTD